MSTTTTTTTTIPEGLMFPDQYVPAEEFKARVIQMYEEGSLFEVEPKGADTDESVLDCIYNEINYNPTQARVFKLKEENDELKAGNESMKKTLQDKFNEIEELQQEIEELKSCLDYDPEEAEIVSKDYIKRLQAENERLKAENEQLNDDDWVIDHHKALKYGVIVTGKRLM